MSHLTTVKSTIKNLDALSRAASSLGLTPVGPGKVTYYNARQGDECALIIKLPKTGYTIGAKPNGDGTFSLVGENYILGKNSSLEAGKIVGPGGCELLKAYQIENIKMQAARQGIKVGEPVRAKDGSVKLVWAGRY